MLKLRSKKGYILLETVISFSLVTIFMYCTFLMQFKIMKLNYYNNKLEQYINCFDLLKSYVESASSYESIKAVKEKSPMYINEENINLENIANGEITGMLENFLRSGSNYIELDVSGNDVLTIDLTMKINIAGESEQINYESYKAAYE